MQTMIKHLFQQETPYLEQVIHSAENINDFDYNKMISDFELSTRHETYLKKIKQRWEKEGRKYNERMSNMKGMREKEYKERNNKLKSKLAKKNELLITTLNEQREAKSAEKQRIIDELMEKELEAKRKVDDFQLDLEARRLKAAARISSKSKIIEIK